MEIKVPESPGRVERYWLHVTWSPVWIFHRQWWFELTYHLLVFVHCVFWSPVNIDQKILEHFTLSSSEKLYGDAAFTLKQDSPLAHTSSGTKSWINDRGVAVLVWPANWEPNTEFMGESQEEDKRHPTKQCRWSMSTIKATWAPMTPEQWSSTTGRSPPCHTALMQ